MTRLRRELASARSSQALLYTFGKKFLLLADQAGFDVNLIEYDSIGAQFWGSEMYCGDIPLMQLCGPGRTIKSEFSNDELADYEMRAAEPNRLRDGDQIVAILRKKNAVC